MAQHNITKTTSIEKIAPWLLTKETYVPKKDKERFLQKTFLEIMGKLSALRQPKELNPRLAVPGLLLSALLLIGLIVASPKLNFPLFILMGFIIALAFQTGEDIIAILKPCILAGLFTLVLLLPSIFLGNKGILFLPIKVFITVLTLTFLTRTVPVQKLIASLGYLKIPSIFILILNLTLNYIFILGHTALDLLTALKLRSVGKNQHKYNSLAGIIGITFLKSQIYAQGTYNAMVCRGFTGKYKVNYKIHWHFTTLIYPLFWLLIITLYIFCLKIN